MRVAVVDIGTNSTRLLIADVASDGSVEEIERASRVTRLGDGVDASGVLAEAAMERVFSTLDDYAAVIERHGGADVRTAVLTSAVRDAANGPLFVAEVERRYGLEARAIPGSEEAQLTYLGATSGEPAPAGRTLVIDAGGGSTELIVGAGRLVEFAVSLQAGVVRQSERHLHSDPPTTSQLRELGEDVAALIGLAVPEAIRRSAAFALAVGGTATSCAAIDQALDPYDPARVHGYRLDLSTLKLLLARLASLDLAERRRVRGLHPDRAPTVIAGVVILICVLEAFELYSFEASEHDILRGIALRRAGVA